MLYTPSVHEPLTEAAWDEQRVRAAIREIARDAEEALQPGAGWPAHPRDEDEPRVFRTLYLGAAGVVWALESLRGHGLVELDHDYVPLIESALEAERAEPEFDEYDSRRSLLMGELGVLLVLHLLAPRPVHEARLKELISANVRDGRCELMWGSPGTMVAARRLGLDALWGESAAWLRNRKDEDGLWTQQLYGGRRRFLGPAHGFAGIVVALGDEPGAAGTLRRFAVEEDGLANWPALADKTLDAGDGEIRLQWCHGAPGMVTSLAHVAPGDDEHERLLVAGGELVWQAGPLAKGANLCHGTAGNGYTFLTLFERTGDERWLERARSFAMHSIEQVDRERTTVGRGRYTLWTGDPGTALYLADCLEGSGAFPICP